MGVFNSQTGTFNYVSPSVSVLEITVEGVLCESYSEEDGEW